ncbi:hypothetical protein IWZ03DRAFT_385863 [Phyllosticta citriasiana]|uniref:Secreted protein n=1 Tax=Phyllosticta citriasiana TaxID=595635 RepID=A0ABR1KES7_9PEZI
MRLYVSVCLSVYSFGWVVGRQARQHKRQRPPRCRPTCPPARPFDPTNHNKPIDKLHNKTRDDTKQDKTSVLSKSRQTANTEQTHKPTYRLIC